MAAAQRSTPTDDLPLDAPRDLGGPLEIPGSDTPEPPSFALRQQVAERLAAHRARRGGQPAPPPADTPSPVRGRSAHIAAAVAQRYAQSPSYRTFLASEAERSVRQAEAAADVATINAEAIAAAQQQLLADLERWDPDLEDFALGPIPVPSSASTYTHLPTAAEAAASSAPEPFDWTVFDVPAAPARTSPAYTVRHFEDVAPQSHHLPDRPVTSPGRSNFADDPEGLLLDEEIAFRQDPTFDEFHRDPLPLSANLLEFPRQLVAARKARPRLAEGPLREDVDVSPYARLRIFEVEADAAVADSDLDNAGPEWSSILLAAHTHTEPEPTLDPLFLPDNHPHTAPIHLRLLAATVDGSILLASLATFVVVTAATVSRLSGPDSPLHVAPLLGAISAAAVLFVLAVVYHLLFFSLSGATPGMRYARIALCTFSDHNPSRSAMRRRLLFSLLSLLPLGLGLLWALLDEDRLGWHDRLSHTYQRSY